MKRLKERFDDRLVFHGGADLWDALPRGTVDDAQRFGAASVPFQRVPGRIKSIDRFVRIAAAFLLCSALIAGTSWGSETSEVVRFTNTVPASGGVNRVPNGSFEAGEAGWSSLGHGAGYQNLWSPLAFNWGNLAVLHGTVERSGGSHGDAFLRIRVGGDNTPVFNFDYFYPVNHRELSPLAASLGWIEVTPGQPYAVSVDMRASREDVPAAFGVRNENAGHVLDGTQEESLKRVVLGTEWKRYTHTFVPRHPFVFVLAGPDLVQEEEVYVDVDGVQLEPGTAATSFAPRSPLEVGVVPTAPAGVFDSGEAALKVTAYNSTNAPAQANVSFRVTDFFDQPADLAAVSVEVPGASAVEKLVPLPAQWQGFYRVVAVCGAGESEETRLVRVAIVPPRTTTETVLGVNHAYPTEFLVALAKKAGVSWYRDWSLKWQHVEPERGRLRWEVSDPQMNRVGAQGARLMAMIPFPSTDWNSSAPDLETLKAGSPRYNAGGKGDDRELLARARWAWAPQDPSQLAGFMAVAVERYREQVSVWEFLNEPLYTSYSLPDVHALNSTTLQGHTIHDYLSLLRQVVPAVRAANPDARIMGGPGMPASGQYTLDMVEAGLLDMVDLVGVHDYPAKSKPEERLAANDQLLAAMQAHGGSKPMWMTEFSYFGTDDLPREPFVPTPRLWSENKLLSEKQVADYTVRYCTIFLARGGEKIFLHSGCTGSVNKPGTESCMFADGAVRKVFPAMAVFTELMGAHPQHVADTTAGGVFVFGFETVNRAVLVLWHPEEKATVAVPEGVTCLDIMGRNIEGPTIPLTGSPLYVVGPAGAARELVVKCTSGIHGT